MADDDRTPWQVDRDRAEATGKWPESWGPFHRHFANDAIHRDGGPECDQPGTPRRVYMFDPDALSEHEAIVAAWAATQAQTDGGDARYSFTRDDLIDALTHLEVTVATSGPIAGKVLAASMADAIIGALGSGGDA